MNDLATYLLGYVIGYAAVSLAFWLYDRRKK